MSMWRMNDLSGNRVSIRASASLALGLLLLGLLTVPG
jgi:hypothetical protein